MGAYVTNFEDIASGTAKKTLIQIVAASTGSRPRVKEIAVSGDSTSATAVPILIKLIRQTTAGTGGVAGTVNKWEEADGTAACTSQVGPAGTWTGEPTDGAVLAEWRLPPTSGMVLQYPLGDEPKIASSGRIALTVTAGTSVNLTGYIRWEE